MIISSELCRAMSPGGSFVEGDAELFRLLLNVGLSVLTNIKSMVWDVIGVAGAGSSRRTTSGRPSQTKVSPLPYHVGQNPPPQECIIISKLQERIHF